MAVNARRRAHPSGGRREGRVFEPNRPEGRHLVTNEAEILGAGSRPGLCLSGPDTLNARLIVRISDHNGRARRFTGAARYRSRGCTREGAQNEHDPYSRLCAPLGSSQRGVGEPWRVDRLVVLPALRQPVDFLPPPGRRSWPLVDLGHERHASDSPLPGPNDGLGDHLPYADGHGGDHRRPRHGRRQPGARARQGCAACLVAGCDVH